MIGFIYAELRWKNGTRVYFAYYVDEIGRTIVVILGGSKKTQKRDILKAKRILKNLSEV
jgi:putative component of toxin-antitoxin plasmid stabilization module